MRERLKMGKLKTTCRKLKNAVIIAHIRTEWYSFSCNCAIIVAKYTGGLVLVLGLVFSGYTTPVKRHCLDAWNASALYGAGRVNKPRQSS